MKEMEKTMEPNDLYEQNQEYIDTIAELSRDKERLQKQLDIAKNVLRKYTSKTALTYDDGTCYALRPYNDGGREAEKALAEIKELDNE